MSEIKYKNYISFAKERNILKILLVISLIIIVSFILLKYIALLQEVTEMKGELKDLQDTLKLKENELGSVRKLIKESAHSAADSDVIAARNDMRKFYIIAGLGVTGALALGIYGVWVWKGLTVYGFLPKIIAQIIGLESTNYIKTIRVIDERLEVTWVIDIINNVTARILISSFEAPGVLVPANVYFFQIYKVPPGVSVIEFLMKITPPSTALFPNLII